MKKVLFSIIVPIYNAEKYLVDAIESVLRQKYELYELILVDDGSKDKSGIICDKYAQNNERIHVIHKQNEGQISARSIGMNIAKGEYLLFLDADDCFLNNALEQLNHWIVQTNADCIIFGYRNGRTIENGEDVCEASCLSFNDKKMIYKKILLDCRYNTMWRKAIKREKCNKVDYTMYYNIRMGEDLIQTMNILYNCDKVAFVPSIVYFYRQNKQSITYKAAQSENVDVTFDMRDYSLDFLRKHNIFGEEDYADYRTYCRKMYCEKMLHICVLPCSVSYRKKLLQRIYNTKWYMEFLSVGGDDKSNSIGMRIIWFLFQKKLFYILMVIARIKIIRDTMHARKLVCHKI